MKIEVGQCWKSIGEQTYWIIVETKIKGKDDIKITLISEKYKKSCTNMSYKSSYLIDQNCWKYIGNSKIAEILYGVN